MQFSIAKSWDDLLSFSWDCWTLWLLLGRFTVANGRRQRQKYNCLQTNLSRWRVKRHAYVHTCAGQPTHHTVATAGVPTTESGQGIMARQLNTPYRGVDEGRRTIKIYCRITTSIRFYLARNCVSLHLWKILCTLRVLQVKKWTRCISFFNRGAHHRSFPWQMYNLCESPNVIK